MLKNRGTTNPNVKQLKSGTVSPPNRSQMAHLSFSAHCAARVAMDFGGSIAPLPSRAVLSNFLGDFPSSTPHRAGVAMQGFDYSTSSLACLVRSPFRRNAPRLRLLDRQHLNRESIVHPLPAPPSRGGRFIDVDPALMMDRRQTPPVADRLRVAGRDAVDRRAVEFQESEGAVIQDLDTDAAFMD